MLPKIAKITEIIFLLVMGSFRMIHAKNTVNTILSWVRIAAMLAVANLKLPTHRSIVINEPKKQAGRAIFQIFWGKKSPHVFFLSD